MSSYFLRLLFVLGLCAAVPGAGAKTKNQRRLRIRKDEIQVVGHVDVTDGASD